MSLIPTCCLPEQQLPLLHPFYGLFSRTTWLSQRQKGKPFWIFIGARDYGVAMASAGPHANHLHLVFQTDSHASTSPLSFTGRMPFLLPKHQHQSTEGTELHLFPRKSRETWLTQVHLETTIKMESCKYKTQSLIGICSLTNQ